MTVGRKVGAVVAFVACGAMVGAVAGTAGNPGRAPDETPRVTSTPMRRGPVEAPPSPPVSVDAAAVADTARLEADFARCVGSGSVGCHVEIDSDGSRSVYGYRPGTVVPAVGVVR